MTTLQTKPKTATAPEIFEVFFFKPEDDGTLFDTVFAKALVDYSRMYGFSGEVVHLAVRLGTHVYEVTTEGTVKTPWTEDFTQDPRISGFFSADITKVSIDKRLAALFTLENMIERELDVFGCLKYLWQSVGLYKTNKQLDNMTYHSLQSQTMLAPSTYKRGKKPMFRLPYTCTTPAIAALKLLINFEPCFNSHLAQSIAFSLSVISDMGFGEMFIADDDYAGEGYLDV